MPKPAKRIIAIVVWLVIWQLLSMLVASPILFCSPIEAAAVLAGNVFTVAFWATVLSSLWRIALGFVIGFVLGIILALSANRFSWASELFAPLLTMIKSVPIVCFIVLLLFWVGSTQVSTIAVALVVLPAIYFSTREGLAARDEKMTQMLKVFDVSRWRKMLAFSWPSMLPFIKATSKVAVGMSWKSGVAAELIGLPLGTIGEGIYQSKILLSSADLFAWTAVIVVAALASERIFLWLLGRLGDLTWRLALPANGLPSNDTLREHYAPERITLWSLSKKFGNQTVLDNLSTTLAPSGKYALTWPSGAGKTTLLQLIAGLEAPSSGNITGVKRVSVVFQETRLFASRSAIDNLALIAGKYHTQVQLEQLLTEVLGPGSIHKPAGELSGGMQRRLELCRALAYPSQTLLLDEPFTGLDAANHKAAQKLVATHLNGRTLVIASHDLNDRTALDLADISK